MADRPCRLRLRSCLLSALLLSGSMAAHAVGIATPQVMSGFNEPLRARVALLDTGALRAGDIRVALADTARWQAMNVPRSADTDTLRLAVNGTPGHLYLDLRGSRALETPWLDVVLTLSWPEGELTPQLTLLPSRDAATGEKTTVTAATPALGQTARSKTPPGDTSRDQSVERQARDPSAATPDNRRLVALEERIDRLEQQLRASRASQAALMTEFESVRAQSLARPSPSDSPAVAALAARQQAFEARLDQMDQEVPAAGVPASDATSQRAPSMQGTDTSPQERAVTPVSEPSVADRGSSLVWIWALAALLLILGGAWAGIRRWRQRRYRFVSVTELSPMASPSASLAGEASAGEGDDSVRHAEGANTEQNETWTAHRAQVEAICAEAEVFHRHGRREHALTMLEEGLLHYPDDVHLMRALAALKAAPDRDEAHDDRDDQLQPSVSTPALDEAPALAPALAPHWRPHWRQPGPCTPFRDRTRSLMSRKASPPVVSPAGT